MDGNTLDALNRVPDDEAAEWLSACNASPRWVALMLAARPFADEEALLTAGAESSAELAWTDVLAALDAHPRIGDRPTHVGTDAEWSRREQAAVVDSAERTRTELHEGNLTYEKRFGHVFLIRAAGRSAEEMLADLHRRLDHDEATERVEVSEQLAQITRLRLGHLLSDAGAGRASVPSDAGAGRASVLSEADAEQAPAPSEADAERASVPSEADAERASVPSEANADRASAPEGLR